MGKVHIGYGPTARESCYSVWFCSVVLVHTHFLLDEVSDYSAADANPSPWQQASLPYLPSVPSPGNTSCAHLRATHLRGLMGFRGVSRFWFLMQRDRKERPIPPETCNHQGQCANMSRRSAESVVMRKQQHIYRSILESTLLPDHKSLKNTQHGTYQPQIP